MDGWAHPFMHHVECRSFVVSFLCLVLLLKPPQNEHPLPTPTPDPHLRSHHQCNCFFLKLLGIAWHGKTQAIGIEKENMKTH